MENHTGHIFEYLEKGDGEFSKGIADQLIVEVDGSMVPVVDTGVLEDGSTVDSRRNRKVRWQEARLCFVRRPDQLNPIFQATMRGGVERAGNLLYRIAQKAGFGAKTKVHGVSRA